MREEVPEPDAAIPARTNIPLVISGSLGSFFAFEAAKRGVRPTVLVLALLQKLREDALVDPVLDEEDPNEIAPGHARRLDGLTRLQSGVLYILALNADGDGVARLTPGQLAQHLSAGASSVVTARSALVGHGYIEPLSDGWRRGSTAPRPYRLTENGWAFARALGGDGVDQKGGAA